jgi:hypothetical protein
MALLDFMKEGFNSLQSQPQMYDPHANARRLMGGPVQEQQGGGTGFNFFGGNNYSQNAQEPLPQMDVTGQVGGPSMTPYQGQEVGPSHLGVTNIDKTNNYSPDLPGGGTYNQYQGIYDENPGARVEGYYNPIASYTAEQMPNSMQSDGSVAKVGIDDLYNQPAPRSSDSNMVWSEELQRYIPITENNAVQQPTGYNPNANTNTSMYPTNLLGTGNELVGPTQPNGGGVATADNDAEAAKAKLDKENENRNKLIDARSYDPYYIDYAGLFGGPGMSFQSDGSEANFNQFDKTKEFIGPNAGGNTDYPGEINNWFKNLFNSTGTGTEDRTFAGGEEVKVDYDPDNQSDYNLKRDRELIINQIMSEDATDEERRQLFEAYGIDPYDYLKEGLISKK